MNNKIKNYLLVLLLLVNGIHIVSAIINKQTVNTLKKGYVQLLHENDELADLLPNLLIEVNTIGPYLDSLENKLVMRLPQNMCLSCDEKLVSFLDTCNFINNNNFVFFSSLNNRAYINDLRKQGYRVINYSEYQIFLFSFISTPYIS